jgi:hypothetical protein
MSDRQKQATRRNLQFVIVDPATAKGPKAFAELPGETSRVDRTGGKYSAGLIRGVSLLTRGEALGHGYWCDSFMLDQCMAGMKLSQAGLKSRFTHPGMCSDGLGKPLGTFQDPRREGDRVVADLHLKKSAHKTPEGNLAEFIMDRAEEDPHDFGTSIVFDPDWDAEDDFYDDNTKDVENVGLRFVSPDPDNKQNLPHARIATLCACDFVDDPAANPAGLFHDKSIPEAERLLDYVTGFSNERPTSVAFGVEPDRVREFFTNWATRRGLKELTMPKMLKHGRSFTETTTDDPTKPKTEEEQQAADPGAGTEPGAVTCPECGAVFVPDKPAEDPQPISEVMDPAAYAANHLRFTKAFGEVNGTKWFLEGKSYSDSQTLHYQAQLAAKDATIQSLQTELTSAKQRLAAVAKDGATPLSASAPAPGTEGGNGAKVSGAQFFRKGTKPV